MARLLLHGGEVLDGTGTPAAPRRRHAQGARGIKNAMRAGVRSRRRPVSASRGTG
ncbi:MAG TPA: hypothetical protein VGH76_22500 [Actinomycetospora sp.]|jgi:hypothetical protein|uniref:hypothetical protein n=1 Tax=Actinomycetospora sp. TaxID=1872135 RepID=UPI002F409E2C